MEGEERYLPLYHIYTDGSSSHVTGEGGWAFVILSDDGFETQDLGYEEKATNNSMELRAAIEGLKALQDRDCRVRIYSDSAYVVNSMKHEWWKEWKSRGWKKQNGQPTPNTSLWVELITLSYEKPVEYVKVKGHSDDKLNDYCDKLARHARKNKGASDIIEGVYEP